MFVGDRMRVLREARELPQAEIEKRTGLLRCCISRVENGHTSPSLETPEKICRALEEQLYQLFYEQDVEAEDSLLSDTGKANWASARAGRGQWKKFRRAVTRMNPANRKLLMDLASQMGNRKLQYGKSS